MIEYNDLTEKTSHDGLAIATYMQVRHFLLYYIVTYVLLLNNTYTHTCSLFTEVIRLHVFTINIDQHAYKVNYTQLVKCLSTN